MNKDASNSNIIKSDIPWEEMTEFRLDVPKKLKNMIKDKVDFDCFGFYDERENYKELKGRLK